MFISAPPSQLSGLGKHRQRRIRVKNFRGYRQLMYMSEVSPPFKAPPGTKWEYEIDGLSGLGRFRLKKILRRVVKISVAPIKAIVKVSKKLAKSKVGRIALIAGGAYFAAPWFLTLVKTVGATAAKALLRKNAPPGASSEEAETETTSSQMPDWIAGPAQAFIQNKKRRDEGEAQAKAAREADLVTRTDNEIYPQARQPSVTVAGETPGWVLPVAIGGAALLLLTNL